MKKFLLSCVLAALMLVLQHSPVLAQNTVSGVIARVTQTGLQLKNGMSYRWANNASTTLANGDNGKWADLQADDAVRLTMNRQNMVASLEVTGRDTGERVERSLTELKPVESSNGWDVMRNPTINGRVFKTAIVMDDWNGTRDEGKRETLVMANNDNYDVFEAWIGKRGGTGNGTIRFTVLGDGAELYRSPKMTVDNAAVRISVPVKGYSGVTLRCDGDENVGETESMVWADPIFIKLPASRPNTAFPSIGDIPISTTPDFAAPPTGNFGSPSVPSIISPAMNALINRNMPLAWQPVNGATGYLLELQAIRLNNPGDANHVTRFLSFPFPAHRTTYNFNVNQMPKGAWRWRVHALTNTGFLGEMLDWRRFISQ